MSGNSWEDMGLAEGGEGGGEHDGFDPGAGHEDTGAAETDTGGSGVVDVEHAEKPKSKAGLYAGIAIAGLVSLAVVGFIGSKVYSILVPPKDSPVPMAGDARPLEMQPPAGASLPGGMEAPAQQPVAAASAGQSAIQPAQAPAVVTPASGAQPPFAAPAPGVSQVQPAQAAVACGPDLSGKLSDAEREEASLRAERDELVKKVAELEKAKTKPAAMSRPRAVAAAKPSAGAPRHVTVAKPSSAPVEKKQADAYQEVASAHPVTESAVAPGAAKGTASAAASQLARFKIQAIYPNNGDFQAAHLVDRSSGRNVVVRVGDVIYGARVTRIDGREFRVYTSEGEIR